MEIILNTNELGYQPFLHSNVDSFVIGLKGFSVNQGYTLNIRQLNDSISKIKETGKNIYISLNLFSKEKDLKRLNKILPKISSLNIDAYIVSDLGVFNVLKKYGLENKVILDLHTYVTNKYSAKSLINLGIKSILLSKEITLEDIKTISNFNPGKITVLAQGYTAITYSNRSILSFYYNKYKLKRNSKIHYIKEETRDAYYYIDENKENLIVYNNKQYSLFPYLLDLMKNNVNTIEINANFLSKNEIETYIEFYRKGIEYIRKEKISEYNKLKEEFLTKHDFDNTFLHKGSFLLKEGK